MLFLEPQDNHALNHSNLNFLGRNEVGELGVWLGNGGWVGIRGVGYRVSGIGCRVLGVGVGYWVSGIG